MATPNYGYEKRQKELAKKKKKEDKLKNKAERKVGEGGEEGEGGAPDDSDITPSDNGALDTPPAV